MSNNTNNTITRDEVISALLQDSIDTIMQSASNNDFAYVHDLLMDGFEGFRNWTDAQLKNEYYELFEKRIEIHE